MRFGWQGVGAGAELPALDAPARRDVLDHGRWQEKPRKNDEGTTRFNAESP